MQGEKGSERLHKDVQFAKILRRSYLTSPKYEKHSNVRKHSGKDTARGFFSLSLSLSF